MRFNDNKRPLYGEVETDPAKRVIFALCIIFLLLKSTPFFMMNFPVTGMFYLLFAATLLLFVKPLIERFDIVTGLYVGLMLIGLVIHLSMPQVEFPVQEAINWIAPALLLVIARSEKPNYKGLVIFALAMFAAICCLDIYERLTFSHPITYKGEILEGFADLGEEDETVFRSFGLLGHPLDNANSLSIIIAFIYASCLKKPYKWVLLLFGLVSMWTINSRGAMLIWIVILCYDLILRDKKWYFSVIGLAILLALLPTVLDYVEETEALGRLSDFDFTDDSSLARLESWGYFFMYNWSSDDLLFGGNLIYIPGTDLLLENGLLLNISYWGWIIGPLKLLLEIIISWKALRRYMTGDKVVIMLATWGLAMMNNNSFNPIVWTYFIVMSVCFASFNYFVNRSKFGDVVAVKLPDSHRDLVDGFKRHFKNKELEKARLYIDKALVSFPESYEVQFLHSQILAKEDKPLSAAKSLIHTLVLKPDHRRAFFTLEEMCDADPDVVLPVVEAALGENPGSEALAVIVAEMMLRSGRYQEAVDTLSGIQTDSRNGIRDIHNILAEAYAALSDTDAARRELALSTIHDEKYFGLCANMGISE